MWGQERVRAMRVTLAGLCLLAVAFAGEQTPSIDAVEDDIRRELAGARVPGAAVAIVSGDEVVARAYGVADHASSTPMTSVTLLHSGSITKLFTALAVAAVLDSRGVPLDAPIGKHMSGLAPRTAKTTFHQLLSQTSGLRDRPGDTGTDDESALAASTRALVEADFLLPGNLVFSYSNLGYATAGAALEALTKQPFADALREAVLAPFGMTASTVRVTEALKHPHAVGHRLEAKSLVPLRTPANDTRIWPAGYLWTNADDMSRALAGLVSRGRVSGSAGLKASVVARVTTPHTELPNVFVGGHYGYGLMVARERGALVHEHGGTMPGYSAIMRIAPGHRFGIAILTNLENVPLRRIAQVVMMKALRLPDAPPAARNETPVSVEELRPFFGVYRNRGTAELAEHDGRVVLMLDGGPAFAVSRIGPDRYLARPKPEIPGPEFVLRPAADGAPAYLHFALWAYVRTPPI
jgi:CubicO group peptidase (beta-lactamase class C family)